ncbi:hypothetical protein COB21_03185 [Candidatus Aerophobetes bacterium]|uniref:Nucleotidyl transferase domain-containing protein n=1 Tax=Aerophobetes bacterium TaxID=2030807 RepID=A0A2A4X507_UNCAE|nr:MAG: hypothetical protein COB21_03185 [Candidatus Aerophobetes bacterium]
MLTGEIDLNKVGILVLAGGDGSRLGFDGPKGAFVVPRFKKSLFEILAEKVRFKNKHTPMAIMTSLNNHGATLAFFEKNNFFGLCRDKCHFFMQESTPMSTQDGHMLRFAQNALSLAPSGNGDLFDAFAKSGVCQLWKKLGIEYVQVAPIDNPLAPVVDVEMLLAHRLYNVSLIVRGIRKREDESIGSLGRSGNKLCVVEYTQIKEIAKFLPGESWGYTGLFSMTFNQMLQLQGRDPIWHKAYKTVQGRTVIKFEKFIFDYFSGVASFKVLASDRNKFFDPIKSQQDL